MAIGFVDNVVNAVRSGINFNGMFRGWNITEGIKSNLVRGLNHEFQYTQVFSFLVQASNSISTFDWNATDEEIRAKYKEINEDMAGTWGQVFGRGIGSATAIALGSGSALVLPKISGARLAQQVMSAASQDAREQLIDELGDAMRQTTQQAGSMLALEGYIKYRQIIKSLPQPVLAGMYGEDTARWIKTGWGAKDGPSMKISEKIDEKIEAIKSGPIQEFVREALDGFTDAFIDTGFVIAQEFDEALRQYQLGQARLGDPEVIEVYPNAENPDERYIIEGSTQEQIEEQTQQIINTHRVMESRDVGQIIATSIESYRSSPMLRKLEIVFKSKPRPPFMHPDGTQAIEKIISIPNVKKNISWQKIKTTFGNGQVAFNAGDRWATLGFKNTNRYLKVRLDDSSIGNAEGMMKEWAELSELEFDPPVRVNDYQGQTARQRKPSMPMYAVKGRLMHTNLDANGRIIRDFPNIYQFDLWQDDPPLDFDNQFNNPQP